MNQINRVVSKIDSADFPALYKAADKASQSGQRTHLKLYKADLTVLVVGALLVAANVQVPFLLQILRALGALLLALSFVLCY
jgi:uncharacterized membrane protein